MNSAVPFLDAITQEPDDLGHRLVYADWLDDHGDPDRAEFVRLQIGRLRLHPADPVHRASLAREADLLSRHERRWLGPLVDLGMRCRFHRGFVEEVSLTVEQLLREDANLFRQAPIRRLNLRNTYSLPALLHANPRRRGQLADLLGRIRVLDLNRDHLSEPAGLTLLELPRLPQLEALHLAHNTLTPEGVAVLARSPVLRSLRTLEFNTTSSSFDSVGLLLRSPELILLEHLSLTGTRQGDRVISLMAGSRGLGRLRSLTLAHCGLTARGMEELVHCPFASSLEGLDLSFNPLDPEGIDHLTRTNTFSRLDRLNLSRTGLGLVGVGYLANSDLLGQLRGLDLSLCRVSNSGGRLLARHSRPTVLGTLDLIYNPLDAEVRKALRQRYGDEVCLFTR